jgi:hypothetical protein
MQFVILDIELVCVEYMTAYSKLHMVLISIVLNIIIHRLQFVFAEKMQANNTTSILIYKIYRISLFAIFIISIWAVSYALLRHEMLQYAFTQPSMTLKMYH